MSYFPPDPGKKERLFYWSYAAEAWVALDAAIVRSLPEKFMHYDEHHQFLMLKRFDMTDEKFDALPQVESSRAKV